MASLMESMESRRMFSYSYTTTPVGPDLKNGVLTIDGTSKADQITINRSAKIGLTIDASKTSSPRINLVQEGVDMSIAVGTHKTDQGYTVTDPIALPPSAAKGPYLEIVENGTTYFAPVSQVKSIHVEGGAGDDYIDIGRDVALPAELVGARGNDTLGGGTKHDTLSGGEGDDVLFGGAGDVLDTFDASVGKDTVATNFTGPLTLSAFSQATNTISIISGHHTRLQDVLDEAVTNKGEVVIHGSTPQD